MVLKSFWELQEVDPRSDRIPSDFFESFVSYKKWIRGQISFLVIF